LGTHWAQTDVDRQRQPDTAGQDMIHNLLCLAWSRTEIGM
jgi:hypothetical protein